MKNILDTIVLEKRREVAVLKSRKSVTEWRCAAKDSALKPRGFKQALSNARGIAVIAEVKKKSPSKGELVRNFNALRIARQYEEAGATAISVLTDASFFGGSLADLAQIRKSVRCPLLRKDFIIDETQIYEAVTAGADAVLLIAAILTHAEIRRLKDAADALGLDALLEVHSLDDFKKLCGIRQALIGINNRDLTTFKVDLKTTVKLKKIIPEQHFVVSESGIKTYNDLKKLQKLGVRAALVGESLVTAPHPGVALKKLIRS